MADMADSASELESDTSSIDGGQTGKMPSPAQAEQLQRRIESLQQENRVLRMELETYKSKYKTLHEENRELKKASVTIVSLTAHHILTSLTLPSPRFILIIIS